VWLIWSVVLLGIWFVFYYRMDNAMSKKEMLTTSMWTALLGLTEPIFIPEYWNPPSLFNLAERTGFDIESIIFAFSVGGIASIIYESFIGTRHTNMTQKDMAHSRHKFHILALFSAPIIFSVLFFATELNPIYSVIIALFGGGAATWYCRPDLKIKMSLGALLFLVLYFVFFLSLVIIYPDYVSAVWNLEGLTGILIFGIPMEELLFALALGFLWSSIYEHIHWKKIQSV